MEMKNIKKLGYIGFGEAAIEIINGLKEEGYHNQIIFSHHQPGTAGYNRYKTAAEQIDVPLETDLKGFLKELDFLFVLVPCSAAVTVSKKVLPELDKTCIYVDLTSSLPDDMKQIAVEADRYNIQFCDGSIMGSVPNFRHQVPIFLSGNGIGKIMDFFSKFNMKLKDIGAEPGAASALKLCRSIYTKGTQALLYEMIKTSDYYGITEKVLESIDSTFYLEGFYQEAERLIKSGGKHARRKAEEMDNVIEMSTRIAKPVGMSKATRDIFRLLEEE